jgi:hypothetical protein
VACGLVVVGCSADQSQPPTPSEGGAPPVSTVPACREDQLGPFTTWDPPRRVVPDISAESPANAVGGTGGGTGGAADGCIRPDGQTKQCWITGTAEVRSGFTFVIESQTFHFAQPAVPLPVEPLDTVWIDYRETEVFICPFCGSHTESSLEVRREEGGELLWLGADGPATGSLRWPEMVKWGVSDAAIEDLFGVPFRRELLCEATKHDSCYQTARQSLEHVLLTDPEQRVPHAELVRVTTPNGGFDVFWTESIDEAVRDPCADGPLDAHDSAFAASRIAP